MSTVAFARGGTSRAAKPGAAAKPGIVDAVIGAVTGQALNGTVNGKRGFQKGNSYASKAHRNQTVASAKSNFTARHAVVRKHVKAGTATTKAGRAAIKDAAAAGRELQAARAAHVAGKAADAKAARAIKSGRAEPLTPRPASAAPKSADHPMVARVEKSKAEVATVQAARATQHLHDLHAGAKSGAIKGADVGRHVDRIARGTTKDQLFAAAKAAGIEHKAGTKKALVDHLKVHAHLHAAGKAPETAAAKPAPAKPAEVAKPAPAKPEAKPTPAKAEAKPTPAAKPEAAAGPRLTASQASEFERATAHGKAAGVDVRLADRALLEKHGIVGRKAETVAAYYHAGTKAIYVNPHSPSFGNREAAARAGHESGLFSHGDADHSILHEIGHAKHHATVGVDAMKQAGSARFEPRHEAIARKVSRYAAKSPAEFVAETYAAKKLGRELPAEVHHLYSRLGGPQA